MCWTLVEIRFPSRASLACSLAIIGLVLVQTLYVLNNISIVLPKHRLHSKHQPVVRVAIASTSNKSTDEIVTNNTTSTKKHQNTTLIAVKKNKSNKAKRNLSNRVFRRLTTNITEGHVHENQYIEDENAGYSVFIQEHIMLDDSITKVDSTVNMSKVIVRSSKNHVHLRSSTNDQNPYCKVLNNSGLSSVDNHQYRSFRYLFHSVPIHAQQDLSIANHKVTGKIIGSNKPQYPYYTNVEKADVDNEQDDYDVYDNDDYNTYEHPMKKFAVCEFVEEQFAYHFPHTMQQLYRCWSWWRSHASDTTTPVLVYPHAKLPSNMFVSGFVEALQHTIGLHVLMPNEINEIGLSFVTNDDENNSTLTIDSTVSTVVSYVRPRFPPNLVDPQNIFGMNDPTCTYFSFHKIEDAIDLRSNILGYIGHSLIKNASAANVTNTLMMNVDSPSIRNQSMLKNVTKNRNNIPRIAILNRHSHRELLVAPDIAAILQKSSMNIETIPIVYFDSNTTFAEQINLFATTDILVSPHGAQLTGIPFMPHCGVIYEIFPTGYYLPYYFGSLAAAAGLQHVFTISTNSSNTFNWRAEFAESMKDRKSRQSVRNDPICIDPEVIAKSVLSLVDSWKQCQQSKDV